MSVVGRQPRETADDEPANSASVPRITDTPSDRQRARPGRPRRIWVYLFMGAGLPAMFSAMVIPFDPALALPWVAFSWPLAALGGYHIWRARNPTADTGREITRRVRGAIFFVAWIGVALVGMAYPQFAALIIGLYLAGMLLILLVLQRNP